jgi:hypothetical protein
MARHAAVDLAQVVNARYDASAPDRLSDGELEDLRASLAVAGLQLRTDETGRDKLSKLRSMYEPYVYSTAMNLMLILPEWRIAEKTRDNWQAGPWDKVIQARGLAVLGQRPVSPPQIEDHF